MKKPSAAKPPDGTVFFIDRCLGTDSVRRVLTAEGLAVEIHDDHFPRDAADSDWLAEVGKRGWVVLTKDQKLRYKPLEIAALKASSARVFILKAGNLRGEEIAARFHEALRAICAMLETEPGHFVAGVTKGGRVQRQHL